MKLKILSILLLVLFLMGCSKSPLDNLADPTSERALNTWSTDWALYDDELRTNGEIEAFGGSLGLDFNYNENGNKVIKFSWDGGSDYNYAGISFLADISPKDLSSSGYDTLSFLIKKESVSDYTIFKIEGPKDTNSNVDKAEYYDSGLSASWEEKSVSLSDVDLTKVHSLASLVFEYKGSKNANGTRSTVYIDDIKLINKK
ncbi:hypothetical protein ACFL4O_02820 [bacterium]